MEKQKDVKVSKMVIQLPDSQISLSIDDAKKLFEALSGLFGQKTVEHHYHDWYYKPYRWNEPYYGSTGPQWFSGNAAGSLGNLCSVKGESLNLNLQELGGYSNGTVGGLSDGGK